MTTSISISGGSRIYPVIGDPIGQVKSPAGMTASFARRNRDAVVIPIHVTPQDVGAFIDTAVKVRNIDGIVVTVPHKIASLAHCRTATARARIVGAVNVMRRNADGSWHGENFDGLGMVGGIRSQGGEPKGKKCLLVGAGGAGMAIAEALLNEGVSELAVHDVDAARRDRLVTRMCEHHGDRVRAGADDPAGFELVVNATPMGMNPDDPYPVRMDRLSPDAFVACVITAPTVSPWVAAARAAGCRGSVGIDMYNAEQELMVEFFLTAPV